MSLTTRKICLVGDFGVGKTSLIHRFVDRQFSDQYLSTVGVKISRKQVEVTRDAPQKALVQLVIWDIEGKSSFKPMAQNYLQGAKGAILVADATQPDSLIRLPDHRQTFLAINTQSVVLTAFNKIDLLDLDQQAHLLECYSRQHPNGQQPLYLTSAKTGANVDLLFQTIAQLLIP